MAYTTSPWSNLSFRATINGKKFNSVQVGTGCDLPLVVSSAFMSREGIEWNAVPDTDIQAHGLGHATVLQAQEEFAMSFYYPDETLLLRGSFRVAVDGELPFDRMSL